MAKARRGGRRSRPPPTPGARTQIRDHWRADGRPKTRFPSQDDANRAALRLRLEEGADLDPYLCPFCDGWHLANRRR
jgi:hypothetical protein